jgi:signal transduction histidine kinase
MMEERAIKKTGEDRYYQLYELFRLISSSLEPSRALDLIIDAAVKITGASGGSLIMIDWQKKILNIEVSRGFTRSIRSVKLKIGEGITGWVAKEGKPLLVRDVLHDSRYVTVKDDIKSELAVPLVVENKLIGVLNVDSTHANAFDEEDLDLLTLLSKQSAQVIRNGQLFDTSRRQLEQMSTLIEINKAIASTLSLEKRLNQIVERTARLMKSKICSVLFLSEDGKELILKAQWGGSPDYSDKPNLKVDTCLIGQVIRSRRSIQVLDITKESGYLFKDLAKRENLKSLLSVPLIVRDRIIGALNIYKSKWYEFSDEEKTLVRTFADLCSVAIENARLYEKMIDLEEQTRRAERLTAVGELAVGIAHEIRNPLTIVKMIFESGSVLTEKDTKVISQELDRMNTIISHLLDYTRPKEVKPEPCDIQESMENTLFLLAPQFDKKNIRVITDLKTRGYKVLADPVHLQQVFLNLLLNARDAISGKGKIQITCRVKRQREMNISIVDNGTGISQKIQENLFVPFTTSKPKGLGLGLSIVHRILKAHNGSIKITSAPGKGTTVNLVIPIYSKEEERTS